MGVNVIERRASEQEVFNRVEQSASLAEALEAMTNALHEYFPHYTGVYIYWLEGDTLVLNNHRGRPTEHTRIPIGAGICGRAARVKQTVTVDDVNADADYLACSMETRSEIVAPILRGGQVLGEIDIDSDAPAAFQAQDRIFLEELARRIALQFG
jgi:L-methionine (R)-S-oxide reductase